MAAKVAGHARIAGMGLRVPTIPTRNCCRKLGHSHFYRRTTTAALDTRQKKREPKRAPVLILREMPAQT